MPGPRRGRRPGPASSPAARDALLDGALRDQAEDQDALLLADAVRAVGGLALDRRVPPRVVVDHRVGRGEVEPVPPALRLMRRSGTSARLEAGRHRWRGRGSRRSARRSRMPRASSSALDQREHLANCENTSTRRPSATSSVRASRAARSSLAPSVSAAAPASLSRARVAADLAQLEQRVEDGDPARWRARCGASRRAPACPWSSRIDS